MLKRSFLILAACGALAACASSKPHVLKATRDMETITLTGGMATQVELPDSSRVKSVRTGNPSLVEAAQDDNVVTLIPKAGSGETNLIVRGIDDSGDTEVYQYRIVVQDH